MAVKISEDDTESEAPKRQPKLATSLTEDALSARDLFLRKARRVDTHKINFAGTDIEVKVQGLDQHEFNRLQADHLPRRANDRDKAQGFNTETFPPAFLARAIIEPKLSEEEWRGVFDSPEWSMGELAALVDLCWQAAQRGFDVPFGGNASG